MKKRMSSAALGLRMTFWPVMAVIVIFSAMQLWSFWRTEIYWIEDVYSPQMAFEEILDGQRVAYHGKFSFMMILSMTLIAPRNKASYTLRRLRISENEVTVQWALLFSGYYLISWAVQLLLTMYMFRAYAPVAELEPLDYFLAVYRSRYLRILLPLGEPWGYVRNVLICLGWGTMGSLVGRYARHGGKPFMGIALVILTVMFLPADMASQITDIWFCVLMAVLVVIQICMIREVERNED